jgi:hypothetical protein
MINFTTRSLSESVNNDFVDSSFSDRATFTSFF